jgi:hypothetical protein
MNDRKPIYITDRDDHGKPFGHLIGVVGDGLYPIELAPHLSVLTDDGRRYRGDAAREVSS